MLEFLKHLVVWTYYHPTWAGIVVFFISASESIAIIGTLIPGSIVMTGIGTLIGAAILPFWATVAWAGAGAFFGDVLSYSVGYILKENLVKVWPFSRRTHWLDKGKEFFNRHGKKSIFIGRFLGPLRAFIPLTAGAMHMPPARFIPTDIISSVVWAMAYMLPGILLGAASLQLPPDVATHSLWMILLGLGVLIVLSWVVRLTFIHVRDVLEDCLNMLWSRMNNIPRLKHVCHALRYHDGERGQLPLALIACIVLTSFVILLFNVISQGALTDYNDPVYHLFRSLRSPSLDKTAILLTVCAQKDLILPAIVGAGAWLYFAECRRASFHWAMNVVLVYGGVFIFKHLIHSPRPAGLLAPLAHSSFPSGHATIAVGIYGLLAYLIASRWPPKVRWMCYATASLGALIIILTRLYLGAHWLTDVAGGTLWGSLCIFITALSYQRYKPQRIRPFKLLAIFLGLMLAVNTFYMKKHFNEYYHDYQPIWPAQTIHLNKWWNSQQGVLPYYQTNRFGQPISVLNLQWASDRDSIISTLTEMGWQHPLPLDWITAIQHPAASHKYNLHIKTALFQDRKPEVVLIKPEKNHTLLLKLWDTGFHFETYPLSLWVGTLSIHTNDHATSPALNQQESGEVLMDLANDMPGIEIKSLRVNLKVGKHAKPLAANIILIKSEPTTETL